MNKCKACGQAIIFIKTRTRKAMPCNMPRIIIETATSEPDTTIITDSGEVVRGKRPGLNHAVLAGQSGHISHFSTCPAANEFRKK